MSEYETPPALVVAYKVMEQRHKDALKEARRVLRAKLRAMRLKSGKSVKEVAIAMGISSSWLSALELGVESKRTVWSVEMAKRFEEAIK